ncbi:phytanoyl-CoA dioxygenase family protein [Puia sp. P3]|uniref:phytanoyl-CoA dioxygenase family protein n=1 Tax=Puia sp. P3 TaxID=3423952 RepID=UPI003D67FB34
MALGKFETYAFMYNECADLKHFEEWMVRLKGEKQLADAAAAFDEWAKGNAIDAGKPESAILSEEQWQSWGDKGFLKISGLVDGKLCDAVTRLICSRLGADLSRPGTWYNSHPEWHGLMLQVYQDESINAIKTLPAVRKVFSELYDTTNIIPNTEKVSFNPLESPTWKFGHNQLHWDIDFSRPNLQYIQGLVYLNDVPEDRGPLTVVPGFHQRFEEWMQTYPDPDEAIKKIRSTVTVTVVPGKKGDLVLWLQTLPHAASANHSDLPRFVQYISFSKCCGI